MEDSPFTVLGIYAILILLTIISIFAIVELKDDYETALIIVSDKGEGVKFTPGMLLFAALTLAVAIMNLLV